MNDDQLIRMLRALDRPLVAPERDFGESLYATLTERRQARRHTSRALLLVAALLAALAIGAAILAGSRLLQDDPLVVIPQATPTARPPRVADVPEGYRTSDPVPFGLGLVAENVMLGWNMDAGTLTRWDAQTFEELETHQLGNPGDFPPNVQSVVEGSDGVWVTLGFDHAVALMDPTTGEITRTVTIDGSPYDVVEADGDLWIADVEWGQVTRYDLATDAEEAIIRGVQKPTDVVVGEGAVWAPQHFGRTLPNEPITAGGMIARIDLATNAVGASPRVGPRPYYLAVGFDAVWTGTATGGTVDRVDAITSRVTHIPIGEDGAFDIEVVGDSVWAIVGPQWPVERVCDPGTSFFVRIDPSTNQVRERITFPCPTAITPAGNGFWVSGSDGDASISTFFEAAD